MASFTEENYLKAIFHLSAQNEGKAVSTNELAEVTQTRAASVTDMLKKLSEKEYIYYKKYQGVTLTESGSQIALKIIRKHRLWEVFLVEKLGFKWDEIHDLAEELEHIKSKELTDKLDDFLGHPKFDPHGDPIPDAQGNMPSVGTTQLSKMEQGQKLTIMGVSEDSAPFLQHFDRLGLKLGLEVSLTDISDFDHSLELQTESGQNIRISSEVAQNIQVKARKLS
ncbi:metal-dependent transcriptional regulator [Jiulongibacter sediminis]|uniref:metal-dependent transcriptional regulator n=1 Tax=Jiulongibacter sediminis TaxID=1605367 RepID=UPI0026F2B09B|nr:metal-dependent transcriptional regulator [Jiulongibacter sediminis]